MQAVDRERLSVDITVDLERDVGHGQRVDGAARGQDEQVSLVCEAAERGQDVLKERRFDRDAGAGGDAGCAQRK